MAALFTATQFRDHEGFTDDPPDDAQIDDLILEWQSWIERVTGQFFDPRILEFSFDGNGTELYQLPLAIINIEWLKVNDSITNLPTDEFAVYKGRQEPNDDRMNPRIKLLPYQRNIFTDPQFYRTGDAGKRLFLRGFLNQSMKGTFGFVEADGTSAPPLILKALRRLVLRDAQKIADGTSPSAPGSTSAGPVVEEWTDGHKYKLAEVNIPPSTVDSSGDQEVDRIVAMYRRPIKTGAPHHGY